MGAKISHLRTHQISGNVYLADLEAELEGEVL